MVSRRQQALNTRNMPMYGNIENWTAKKKNTFAMSRLNFYSVFAYSTDQWLISCRDDCMTECIDHFDSSRMPTDCSTCSNWTLLIFRSFVSDRSITHCVIRLSTSGLRELQLILFTPDTVVQVTRACLWINSGSMNEASDGCIWRWV